MQKSGSKYGSLGTWGVSWAPGITWVPLLPKEVPLAFADIPIGVRLAPKGVPWAHEGFPRLFEGSPWTLQDSYGCQIIWFFLGFDLYQWFYGRISSVDAIAIPKIWKHYPPTNWLSESVTHPPTGVGATRINVNRRRRPPRLKKGQSASGRWNGRVLQYWLFFCLLKK